MGLFKKKTSLPKSWNTMDLETYMKVREIINNVFYKDGERNLRLAALFNDITYDDILGLPISVTDMMVNDISFLYERPKADAVRRTYTLNGRKYTFLKETVDMTTAQYIDYQSIVADGFENHIIDLMMIMLVPEGHSSNDGYDREQVEADVKTLSVTEALGIADFFLTKCRRLLRRTLLYSKAAMLMARMKAPKEMKREMKNLERLWDKATDELLSMCGYLSLKSSLQ